VKEHEWPKNSLIENWQVKSVELVKFACLIALCIGVNSLFHGNVCVWRADIFSDNFYLFVSLGRPINDHTVLALWFDWLSSALCVDQSVITLCWLCDLIGCQVHCVPTNQWSLCVGCVIWLAVKCTVCRPISDHSVFSLWFDWLLSAL